MNTQYGIIEPRIFRNLIRDLPLGEQIFLEDHINGRYRKECSRLKVGTVAVIILVFALFYAIRGMQEALYATLSISVVWTLFWLFYFGIAKQRIQKVNHIKRSFQNFCERFNGNNPCREHNLDPRWSYGDMLHIVKEELKGMALEIIEFEEDLKTTPREELLLRYKPEEDLEFILKAIRDHFYREFDHAKEFFGNDLDDDRGYNPFFEKARLIKIPSQLMLIERAMVNNSSLEFMTESLFQTADHEVLPEGVFLAVMVGFHTSPTCTKMRNARGIVSQVFSFATGAIVLTLIDILVVSEPHRRLVRKVLYEAHPSLKPEFEGKGNRHELTEHQREWLADVAERLKK